MILDAIDTDQIEMTEEQRNLVAVINHQMVLQDQFNQLTKHCELLYTRLSAVEKLVQAKVLS